VLNVAIALHCLEQRAQGNAAGASDVARGPTPGDNHQKTLVVSTLGGEAYGPVEQEFAQLGIARRWVPTAARTRVCTTVVDRRSGDATELVENAHEIAAAELDDFRQAFRQVAWRASVVVLTGSLPHGAPTDFYRTLLEDVGGASVLDFRGPELLATLAARPTVVKPNRAELAATVGRSIRNEAELRTAMEELVQRGARAVVATAGKEGVWLASDKTFERFSPPGVARVVNPIACGDCFAAGMAWALSQGADLRAAIEEGMVAAAGNLQTLLPADLDGRRQRLAAR
jgi:1-phosphofructokinase family hexose kinase